MADKKTNVGRMVTSGLFWTFGERIGAQLVSTIVTIILARLLEPSHYGIISIVAVTIAFCDVFVSSGFGKAVIQKENAEDIDYNTAFIISETAGIILYVILLGVAPFIAKFFNEPLLTPVIRVMGIRIPIAALNNIQQSFIQKHLQFRKFFFATLIGTVTSGIVGIIMAYMGAGVWALVAQYLSNSIIDTILLGIICGWKLGVQFSKKSAKNIISFGGRILAGDLVDTTQREMRTVLIGKVFGSADLAFYDQGLKFPKLFVNNLTTAVSKVMLPTFSEFQSEEKRLKEILRKSIHVGVFCVAPIMFGLIGCAEKIVLVLFTQKWIACVPYIYIFSISYLTRPLETFCSQAILSKGRSDITLLISIIINITAVFTVVVSVFIIKSVLWIALGVLISSLVSYVCHVIFSAKLIGYEFKEQIHDIMPPILSSLLMAIIVRGVGFLPINNLACLILQILTGICSYVLFSRILKMAGYYYLKRLIGFYLSEIRRK